VGGVLLRLEPYRGKVLDVRTFGDRPIQREGVVVSAESGDLTALAEALKERFLGPHSPEACLGALATQRQLALLDELVVQIDLLLALPEASPPELAASALQGMWGLLTRLTGEDRVESSLDHVFSGFCLGK